MNASVNEQLRRAVGHALARDWQAAHLIAQDHEGERLADWIHAVAHRMEGDLGNAAYWYGRCGRPREPSLTIEAELQLIRSELEA
jgi:hypothetical protein